MAFKGSLNDFISQVNLETDDFESADCDGTKKSIGYHVIAARIDKDIGFTLHTTMAIATCFILLVLDPSL